MRKAAQDLSERLATVVVTTVTPFRRDGSVDYDTVGRHAEFLVDNGIRVLTPCGNTGEFSSLSLEEIDRITRRVVEAVGERATILAGVGGALPIAADLARKAEDAGAQALLVHYPVHTYVHPDGLRAYYEGILGAVEIGLVLYKRGPLLTDELIGALVESDRIVGVKYAVNDVAAFADLVGTHRDRTAWLCGTAERWAPFFAVAGARGFTSGLANFAPQKALALHAALAAGDYSHAMRLSSELAPFERLRASRQFDANNVPAVKAALSTIGAGNGIVRDPLLALDESDQAKLKAILRDWGPEYGE